MRVLPLGGNASAALPGLPDPRPQTEAQTDAMIATIQDMKAQLMVAEAQRVNARNLEKADEVLDISKFYSRGWPT